MNMRSRWLVLPLALAAMMTAAHDDPFKPSKGEQLKLGKQAAKEIRSHEKVLPKSDPRVRLLNKIATNLLKQIKPSKDEPWEFSFDVINDKEVNAFALPGGPVFFFTGLIDKMQTEDEMAGVLAHEMTHIRREHWAYAYRDEQKRNLLFSGLLILGNASRTVQQATGVLNEVAFSLPFSRKHESEADEQGLQLMVQAGYNPHGMESIFKKLDESSREKPPEFLATHPDAKNRVKKIDEMISKMNQTFPEQRPLPKEVRDLATPEKPKKDGSCSAR